MRVLWNTDKPLSAAEIAENIPNRTWPASSIQNILKKLESKHAVEVAEITKIGKAYGRLFRPALTANEYAAMQFRHYYQKSSERKYALVCSLLDSTVEKEETIRELKEILDQYEGE